MTEGMVLDDIPFQLDIDALFRRLHLDPAAGYADIVGIATEAAALARPKALYREAYIRARGEETITIEGVTFTSRPLRANLDAVERVFPHVVTCGVEMDQTPVDEENLLGRYALDCVKEMALHAALAHLTGHLKQRHGLTKMAAMHPGSGDENVWPIQQQRDLFALLGDVEGRIGVHLTDTFLMHPNKTVSGIYFPTQVDFVTCQLCHREDCPSRRAPFDPHLWSERMGDGAG